MKLIQDELKRIMECIQADLKLDNITFYYSTVNEFYKVLLDRSDKYKYPFFFVNSVNVTYERDKYSTVVSVDDIVLAVDSDSKWSAEKRDEQSFKPILIPIYECFIDKLKRDRHVELESLGTITLHYFYGESGLIGYESGKYPDHVDAIQLKNFKFRLTNNCKK